jgi:hypothetical protein
MSFVSNVDRLTLDDGVYNNVHGDLNIIHNAFYEKGYREHLDGRFLSQRPSHFA